MGLSRTIHQVARSMKGVSVTVTGHGVAIGDDIFLQGDEAAGFEDEAGRIHEALHASSQVTWDEICLYLAHRYVC